MSREQTMQPFAPGDIFLGLTELDDPTDDHAGPGRIVQYGADLRTKGELWTEGGHHLVGGSRFCESPCVCGFLTEITQPPSRSSLITNFF